MDNLPRFIVNTEYATLKNFPATITHTINISAGGTILAGNYVNNQSLITPTSISIPKGAPLQVDISLDINSNLRWQSEFVEFVENFSLANQYQGIVMVSLNNENQISINVSLFNGNGVSVTTKARTIVVRIRSFEPPFS